MRVNRNDDAGEQLLSWHNCESFTTLEKLAEDEGIRTSPSSSSNTAHGGMSAHVKL